MVSWGTSFYKGFVILLWCIVWGIIGGVIAVAFGLGSLWVNLSQPDFWRILLRNPQYILAIISESLVGFLIGGLIAFIGQFASFFKVAVDGATGQMQKLKNELTELKEDVTRRIAKESVQLDEATKDLEKKIQEVKNETTEAIAKTKETLSQFHTTGEEKRDLPCDAELQRFSSDLARDIADRIVFEIGKNSRRAKEAVLDSILGED